MDMMVLINELETKGIPLLPIIHLHHSLEFQLHFSFLNCSPITVKKHRIDRLSLTEVSKRARGKCWI